MTPAASVWAAPLRASRRVRKENDQRICAWIERRHEPLTESVQALIKARSENPPGNESAPAAIVLKDLKRLGARTRVFEPVAGRTSVIGIIDSGRPGPSILCNAHLDTVPAGDGWSMSEPFAALLRHGRVYGRGASDHKSPIACLLYAVEALMALDCLHGRLVLVFDADEELGGTLGMQPLLDEWDPKVDMALYAASTSYGPDGARFFGIGTDNVFRSSVGRLRVRATYGARTPYQVAPTTWWYPAEVAAAVSVDRGRLVETPSWFGGNPRMRLIDSANTQQTWDVFVLPDEDPDELFGRLSRRIRRLAREHGASETQVEQIDSVWPSNCPADNPMVRALVHGAEAATGRTPYVGAIATYMGMSQIQEKLRIPVVAFGYGRIDLCHIPNEWVSVKQIVSTAKAYAVALSELGGSSN
jgi:succinyl-diaminopimelate desuccinylase